jgi:hypothetical protein
MLDHDSATGIHGHDRSVRANGYSIEGPGHWKTSGLRSLANGLDGLAFSRLGTKVLHSAFLPRALCEGEKTQQHADPEPEKKKSFRGEHAVLHFGRGGEV